MPRDAKAEGPRLRPIRTAALAAVWLVGLAAGFYAFLASAARYGCISGDDGLACGTSGSVAGVVLLVTVVATVTAVTLLSIDRPVRPALGIAGGGLAVLAVCLFAARTLLSTA